MKKKIKGETPFSDILPEPRKKSSVIFNRCAHSVDDIPDTYIYSGHPDDALFEFIYQELGYSITIVETDGNGNVTARPM